MKVTIYTVDYCPYCKRALSFLDEKNVKYEQIKIDEDENTWRNKLGEMYSIEGEVTVPQIIIDDVRIGGYSDMMASYENGALKF